MPSNSEWQAQITSTSVPYSGSPVSYRIRTCCTFVFSAVRSLTCCRTVMNYFSHGAVFSSWSAMMHPPKVEVIRVTVGICRTCHEGRPTQHRITCDTILEHDTMGSFQKYVGIGSKCRLAGALQVLAVFTMCSARDHRSQTRSKRVVWKLFSHLPPSRYEQCV